jgi:hypothetical protein
MPRDRQDQYAALLGSDCADLASQSFSSPPRIPKPSGWLQNPARRTLQITSCPTLASSKSWRGKLGASLRKTSHGPGHLWAGSAQHCAAATNCSMCRGRVSTPRCTAQTDKVQFYLCAALAAQSGVSWALMGSLSSASSSPTTIGGRPQTARSSPIAWITACSCATTLPFPSLAPSSP